jgi:ribosomal protein S18 acetylase RimI-like enzyme
MALEISEFRAPDRDEVLQLWTQAVSDGTTLGDLQQTLALNLGRRWWLSLVAREQGRIVGAIVCDRQNQDRYTYQLAIAKTHADRGLAKLLVDKAFHKLHARGIHKCHLSVPESNQPQQFWEVVRWQDPPDLHRPEASADPCCDESITSTPSKG